MAIETKSVSQLIAEFRKLQAKDAITPEGKDYTVEQIRRWHLARKFSDVGYHFIIYRDGSVHRGRHVGQSRRGERWNGLG